MKRCELCDRAAAAMYCDSDQASLCWDCDASVHGANFLVARHSRSLLCRRCQSPTQWRADGARLSPTAAACERCSLSRRDEDDERENDEDGRENDEGDDDRENDDDDDDDEDEEEEEEEEEEEDTEYQVVPWMLTPPPPADSSSSSDESSYSRRSSGFMKRTREDADLASQDNRASSSSFQQRPHMGLPSPDDVSSFSNNLHYFNERRRVRPVLTPLYGYKHHFVRGGGGPDFATLNIHSRRDHQRFDLVSSSSRSPPI